VIRRILSFLIIIVIAALGVLAGGVLLRSVPLAQLPLRHPIYQSVGLQKPEVIGFLPYWLVTKADQDYSRYLTQISYFGLEIGPDAKVVQKVNAKEEEPGWTKLRSTSLQDFFKDPKVKGVEKSLLVHNATEDQIKALIQEPEKHADTLISEVAPLMKQYQFTDLNLDIESFRKASPSAQAQFTSFVHRLHDHLQNEKLGTLTIDIPNTSFFKEVIIDPVQIEPYVDKAIIMAYDYHYRGSMEAGPVAPVGGGGEVRDFDITQTIQEATKAFPAEKVVLGIPLYGYEWETITPAIGAAVIPGTGVTATGKRAQEKLLNCEHCQIGVEETGKEPFIIFQDQATSSAHQVFYEDKEAMRQKLKLAEDYKLGGVALWALGYEDQELLEPLAQYKSLSWWK
jgi:spore germination protein